MSTYSDSTKRVKRRYHRHLLRGTYYPSKALQRSTPRPQSSPQQNQVDLESSPEERTGQANEEGGSYDDDDFEGGI